MVDQGWSVRDAERWAKGRARRKPARPAPDPNVTAAADRLQFLLGTKVEITAGRRAGGPGSIRIHYYNDEDLNRIYTLLTQRARQDGDHHEV